MRQHHGWTIDELEGMIPYERQIYVDMLLQYLKELEEKRRMGQ